MVEFVKKDSVLLKGAISSLTADKIHNHQQVASFEERMIEIIHEVGTVRRWKQFSDGRGTQFKSRYVIPD